MRKQLDQDSTSRSTGQKLIRFVQIGKCQIAVLPAWGRCQTNSATATNCVSLYYLRGIH